MVRDCVNPSLTKWGIGLSIGSALFAPNRSRRIFISALLAIVLSLGCKSKPSHDEIIVGAATSMRHAFPALVKEFEKEHPSTRIVVTQGASGDIARQVQAGAGVDVVVFASKAPIDKLVKSGHVDASTTKVIGKNEIVLVGPERGPSVTFSTLHLLPAGERLAIGDPNSVPVGQYAREALEGLSLWDKLSDRVVYGANVAAVLAYVQRGEVAAAIVYRTEIEGVKGIVVLDVAKGPWAPRPEIWAGVVAASHNRPAAQKLVDFLASSAGTQVLQLFGFGPP